RNIGKYKESLAKYADKINELLKLYNTTLVAIAEGEQFVTFGEIFDQDHPFWGRTPRNTGLLDWLKKRNAEKELEMIKCDIVNLLTYAKEEVTMANNGVQMIDSRLQDSISLECDVGKTNVLAGLKVLAEEKRDQATQWRVKSIQDICSYVGTDIDIDLTLINIGSSQDDCVDLRVEEVVELVEDDDAEIDEEEDDEEEDAVGEL
ncbi:hypothetical protein ABG067_007853, partial [Albugo candida]